ncbi:MAG: hypothetical protein Q4P23_05185 [Micrococcaceae bacterium]|nr:hypothetical protein [Micrococcaceae bacterium]
MIPTLVAVLLAGAAAWLWSGSPTRPALAEPKADHTDRSEPGTSGSCLEEPAEPLPLVLEMCATLLDSGLPIGLVLRILGANVPGYGSLLAVTRALDLNVGWDRAWSQGNGAARELEQPLRLTRLSGVPAAALLRSSAVAARKRGVRQAEARGAEFGIKLMIPLGLCALPAFICLGVVPVVVSLLPEF